MGKAAIINPYLDTLGGGEKYTLSFAKVLTELGYAVDVEWKNVEIKKKLEDRFGMNLSEINFKKELKKGDGYDLCFWVSDGSIPLLHARNNIIHFQIPFKNVDGRSLMNKMKLFRVDKIICNSIFTKSVIDQEFGVESEVIYPPINVDDFKTKRKENIILYVGRFSRLTQDKRQDILIDVFNKMKLANWKLILAGGTEVGFSDEMNSLMKIADNNIEIVKSPDFKTIKDLYGKAKIFWSASGFGVDELKQPEKLEHFGMTVVESMASGAVPVIYNAGGHKEIIQNSINGYLWNNIYEFVEITKNLIGDKSLLKSLSEKAIKRSFDFDYEKFRNHITKIL